MIKSIELRGVRTNNLKNFNLDIPLKKLTVITGVSGSGKSSLAFETLFAEGQRRYVESLSTYTRQFLEKMPKPEVDSITNIPPSIALEQKNHINNNRSTVATMSELYDYLRVLFAKIGKTYCSQCGEEVKRYNPATVAKEVGQIATNARFYILAPLDLNKKNYAAKRQEFLAFGYERFLDLASQEIIELSATTTVPKKLNNLYLVLDRMSTPEYPEKDGRLIEAIEHAFSYGQGVCTIAVVEANKPTWSRYTFSNLFRCEKDQIVYLNPEPQHFSFNSPLGACASCSGFGFSLELDEDLVVPDRRKTLRNGAIDPLSKPSAEDWQTEMFEFCEKHKINLGKRYDDLNENEKQLLWKGDGSKKGFKGIYACFEELKRYKYKIHVRVFIRRYQKQSVCLACKGSRLNEKALAVRIGYNEQQRNISQVLAMSLNDSYEYFKNLALPKYDETIAKDALAQVEGRLEFLTKVGVGYLTLNRLSKTLSGGECQRIYLATQLGNKLCSTLYVLDEPSIGLHAADTEKLIQLLLQLRDHGNTLVVVEHDLDVMSSADHLVEIGPYAGFKGGEVIAAANTPQFLNAKASITAKYLTGAFSIPRRVLYRSQTEKKLRINGACENNLKDIDVEFPLQNLIAVTGVSGSGKTTLVHHTLYNALARMFHHENLAVGRFQRMYGADLIDDVVLLDQKPIGKSARSNPATYMKMYDDIRSVFANQSLAIRRGYTPQYFSFNVDGGRCPVCKGEGEVTYEMYFMADLKLRCEECDGKKFKKNVLEVEYKKHNIDQVLHTTLDEAYELFREYPNITSKIQTLRSVGLGYLQLGQSSTTLSGGESQRLKIASVLHQTARSNVLYIFDEPTTGLHVDDIKKLNLALQDLVDQKNTVIVIEHNLDLIAQADWIIDIGPHGGVQGGEVVFAGTVDQIGDCANSLTGKHLKKHLHKYKT